MNEIETEYGLFTSNEITGQSAEEVYQEWLENKDKPPLPTKEELLQKQIDDMKIIIDAMLNGGGN